jgi:hypothetical protein
MSVLKEDRSTGGRPESRKRSTDEYEVRSKLGRKTVGKTVRPRARRLGVKMERRAGEWEDWRKTDQEHR